MLPKKQCTLHGVQGKTADPGFIVRWTYPLGLKKETVWLAYYAASQALAAVGRAALPVAQGAAALATAALLVQGGIMTGVVSAPTLPDLRLPLVAAAVVAAGAGITALSSGTADRSTNLADRAAAVEASLDERK